MAASNDRILTSHTGSLPRPEDVAQAAGLVERELRRIDLGALVREEVARALGRAATTGGSSEMYPVQTIVLVGSRKEAMAQNLDGLLEVAIEKIVVSSPRERASRDPLVLSARARLLVPETGEEFDYWPLTDVEAGSGLDWQAAEDEDFERFALSLNNDLRTAARKLASELVETLWARPSFSW